MLPNINSLRLIDTKLAYYKKIVHYLYELDSFLIDYDPYTPTS